MSSPVHEVRVEERRVERGECFGPATAHDLPRAERAARAGDVLGGIEREPDRRALPADPPCTAARRPARRRTAVGRDLGVELERQRE